MMSTILESFPLVWTLVLLIWVGCLVYYNYVGDQIRWNNYRRLAQRECRKKGTK